MTWRILALLDDAVGSQGRSQGLDLVHNRIAISLGGKTISTSSDGADAQGGKSRTALEGNGGRAEEAEVVAGRNSDINGTGHLEVGRGAGRDIGNFDFAEKTGATIEPPKFTRIYEMLKEHNANV